MKYKRERDELKKKLLSKKEQEFKDMGTSLVCIAKNEKMCLEENAKSVEDKPFDPKIRVGINYGFY